MADIIDVITRLGFDVDSTKLAEAYQKLINQISALSTLSDRVKKLKDIKKVADTENINRINRINAAIEITNSKIKAQITSIHDQVLANEQLRKSIEGYISVINRAVTDQQKMQNVIASSFAAEQQKLEALKGDVASLNSELTKLSAKKEYGFGGQITELTAKLNSATQAVIKQQAEVDKLAAEYAKISGLNPIDYSGVKEGLIGGRQSRISQLRDALPFANTKEDIKEINREIDRLEKELRELQAIGRKPIITKTAVSQATQGLQDVSNSGKATTFALTNLSYIVQDLPFGFIGIANNITPAIQAFAQVKQEAGSTSGAFKNLLGALKGPQGLFLAVSVVTSLLLTFGDRLFDSGENAKEAAEKIKKEKNEVKSLNDELERNIELRLRQREMTVNANNQGINEARQEEALSKARGDSDEEQYQASKRRIEKEQEDLKDRMQLYAGLARRVNQLFKYYREQESNQGFKKGVYDPRISKNVAQLFVETLQVSQEEAAEQAENLLKTFGTEQSIVNTWLNERAKLYEDVKDKEVQLEVLRLNYIREQTEKAKEKREEDYKNALEQIEAYQKALDKLKVSAQNYDEGYISNLEKELSNKRKAIRAILEDMKKDFDERLMNEVTGVTLTDSQAAELNAELLIEQGRKKRREQDEKDAKKEQERREKNQKVIIDSAKQTANTLIQIMQDVSARQIQILDYEIQVRQQRVQQAVLLAEQGNAEILKSEQERLNETMREREKAANRQRQINALSSASNSALAITEAIKGILAAGSTTAAEGGGIVGYIAAIVAGFAAVAGLYASVKNLTAPEAFKDGVVSYNGKGTETSDSNLVRISKGESVITAQATKQYKPILEAMNNNKPLPMPITLPYPSYGMMGNNKSVEKRLDTIAALLEGNGVSVNTSVTNGQIATIVESQRKIESRRWN